MMRTRSLLAAVAVVASLTAAGSSAQQAQPIAAGVIYQAGARIASPLSGISFSLPAGYAGQWDESVGAVIVQAPTPVIGGVWGWSEGAIEDVALEIGTRLTELGIQLEPREAPTTTENGLRGVFHAMTPEGPALLVAALTRGPSGNVVAIAALGAPEVESDLAGFVDAVSASVEWSPPGAAAWRSQVQGSVLDWSNSGSDISTGGVGTATVASQSQARLSFCGLDQYHYTESSETYVSTEGMSSGSESSDEHAGAWYLIVDLAGTPTLFLEATDGRIFDWSVEEAEGGFLIDGYLYRPSGGCQ